jgi:diguanylate cyclase
LLLGLRRLVGLLFLNLGELVGDESWFSGQMVAMQALIDGNLSPDVLHGAERGLRDLVFKQGTIKGSLDEAKEKLRSLITTFIDRIGAMSDDADGYHARIGEYSVQIGQAHDIGELTGVLEGLSEDMNGMRHALRSSHRELQEARAQAEQAESRIHVLEAELAQVSNLVREDQLTGALNRRGMEEAFTRELARADRLTAPLAIALLDIDHFKKLNDSLGHQAGDEALKHLTRVVRDLLRPTDSLARYGGEEFLIMLPNTDMDEAERIMKRLQRELTRQFFLHANDKVLITFSAGVAQRQGNEDQTSLIARADAAMYRAKAAGRNRVERG